MTILQLVYLTFGVVLIAALLVDLGLMSKKNSVVTMKKALLQTFFWVGLSLAFWFFLWIEEGGKVATKYISAYLMEWSLSIDNIFVFILIFGFFKVQEKDTSRALLIGILLAIILRILFIALGIELINRFGWLLYIFGAFLLYTGIKLFFQKSDDEFNPSHSKPFQFISRFLRVYHGEPNGSYIIKQQGKVYFTMLSLVVLMMAITDIVFAIDSIPTVVSLVRDSPKTPFSPADILVIYSSNIFAVLGLRSLFFLLKGTANKFAYLQHGIAVILAFIGVKMLVEFFHIRISIYISLGVIVACIAISILYSMVKNQQNKIVEG